VITEIRARVEISQGDLALKLGYNTSYIGMIERGEKSMTLRTLEDLAGFFKTTASGLLAPAVRKRRSAKQSKSVRIRRVGAKLYGLILTGRRPNCRR
jgi:transcriptional regulator with XRE-family HTH domain